MQTLPTRAELALHFGTFERQQKRHDLIATVLFMAALIGNLPLIRWLEPREATWIMVPVIIAEFASAIVAAASAKRRARAAGVACPSCGGVFMHTVARQVVVATGYCVECAAPVTRDAVDVRGFPEVGPEAVSARTNPRTTMLWLTLIVVASLGLVAYGVIATRGRASLPPAVGVTVEEAAARIEASRGRPSVVLLYGTRCRPRCRVLADFAAMVRRHPEVAVLAFSDDERGAAVLPALLWRHDANFAPVYLRRWPNGSLDRAMAPLGIHIGTTWTPHLIAVRDANGRVVVQGQAVQDVTPYERALDGLSVRGGR